MDCRWLACLVGLVLACGGDDSSGTGSAGSGSASGGSGSGSGATGADASGSDGSGSASGSGGGTSMPQGCEPSEFEVSLDGVDTVDRMPVVQATGGEFAPAFDIVIGTDTSGAKPWHTIGIFLTQYEGEAAINLDNELVTYAIAEDDAPQILVSTMPTAGNVFSATVQGSLAIEQPGLTVGSDRCGTFDFTLNWTDNAATDHELTATGTFAAVVEEATAPGPDSGP